MSILSAGSGLASSILPIIGETMGGIAIPAAIGSGIAGAMDAKQDQNPDVQKQHHHHGQLANYRAHRAHHIRMKEEHTVAEASTVKPAKPLDLEKPLGLDKSSAETPKLGQAPAAAGNQLAANHAMDQQRVMSQRRNSMAPS